MGSSYRRFSWMVLALAALAVSSAAHALRFQEMYTTKGAHVLVVRDCKNFSLYLPPFDAYDRQHPCRGGDPSDDNDEGVMGPDPQYVGDEAVLDLLLNLSEHGGSQPLAGIVAVASGYGGDTATVETILSLMRSPKPFDEVWLNSGGGEVDAGVGIARVLRKHHMTVHVPAGYQCISACTLAFMGGVLRYIDADAKFRVHSASEYEGGVPDEVAAALKRDPDAALIHIAQSQRIDQRYFAMRVTTLFRNTLALPVRVPQMPEDDAAFCRWAGGQYDYHTFPGGRTRGYCDTGHDISATASLSYAAPGNPERAADVARIRREGAAAYQDILMRIERECMQLALTDLGSTLPASDLRAKAALEMVRTMFITSIMDTNYLTPNQLITMGYVTPTFNGGS